MIRTAYELALNPQYPLSSFKLVPKCILTLKRTLLSSSVYSIVVKCFPFCVCHDGFSLIDTCAIARANLFTCANCRTCAVLLTKRTVPVSCFPTWSHSRLFTTKNGHIFLAFCHVKVETVSHNRSISCFHFGMLKSGRWSRLAGGR